MSLGGRDNQDPFMGMMDVMMDTAHDQEIDFLKRMSDARAALTDFLVDGRPTRDLGISFAYKGDDKRELLTTKRRAPNAVRQSKHRTAQAHTHEHEHHKLGLEYDSIASRGWLASDAQSMVLMLVSVEKNSEDVDASFELSAASVGLAEAESYDVSVVNLATGEEELLGRYEDEITGTVTVAPRQLVVVKVAAEN
mmetsp:Transcript_2448/g.4089  ORF Transcript_2448/g.4089 Transcript_2448/m.4089 type:complete len:195 (-) Transcript_2448:245-829(-)